MGRSTFLRSLGLLSKARVPASVAPRLTNMSARGLATNSNVPLPRFVSDINDAPSIRLPGVKNVFRDPLAALSGNILTSSSQIALLESSSSEDIKFVARLGDLAKEFSWRSETDEPLMSCLFHWIKD
eukprot:Opistho-2@81368